MTNRLKNEKSPYLLQHKNNPVDWYPWGEEAFKASRDQNKPVFLSIGYSTCYWCHMMEKDSFEIQEVAEVLNKDFISIKVDREEHPDVDQIYMDAVVSMTGQGGWPMSVFLTPDLKPFFGGTFYWQQQFLQLLANIAQIWKTEPAKIFQSSQEIVNILTQRTKPSPIPLPLREGVDLLFKQALEQWEKNFDSQYGGFGSAPKFPHSMALSVLLRIYRRTKNETALNMATKTLDAMARGGIYDSVGGGFHRYATHADWSEPHYEKMLYDNALLAWTYLEAFQETRNKLYATAAKETLDYVLHDMTDPQGGFYSAEDAGEVGKEGEFYRLSKEEREKNLRPHKDDKILTSWNGLMIAAMAKASQVLGEEKYLKAAQKSAHFIQKNLFKKGELLRRFREGDSRYLGTLDDYAFLIHGLLSMHAADPNSHWLEWAQTLQAKQDKTFWDEGSKEKGYFFSDPNNATLYLKKKEFHDGATPSGNAMSALNLLQLYALTHQDSFREKALALLEQGAKEMERIPSAYAQTLIALDYFLDNKNFICTEDTCTI